MLAISTASTSTGVILITSPDGESLASWTEANNLYLHHNPMGGASLISHRWNIGTNHDLAFASVSYDNQM